MFSTDTFKKRKPFLYYESNCLQLRSNNAHCLQIKIKIKIKIGIFKKSVHALKLKKKQQEAHGPHRSHENNSYDKISFMKINLSIKLSEFFLLDGLACLFFLSTANKN